jgi:hypothetical protein
MALATIPSSTALTSFTFTRGELYDTLHVNNLKFAIFQKPLTNSSQSQSLTIAADCQCVFLAPIEAELDISIDAINILALGFISAKNGATRIHAKNFYGLGLEFKGDVFVQADRDVITAGLHGNMNRLHVKGGRNALVHCGLTERIQELVTEIKTLFVQGIDQTNGLQLAQVLLKTAQILDDPKGEKAITLEPRHPLLLTDS